MKKLAVAYVRVDALTPYAKNARTHSEAQIGQLAQSIRKFGWTNPILVDGAKGIIAGHGRLAAAKVLGMTEVPVIELAGLTAAEKRAYILADNKLALNAGWDEALLSEELRALGDAGLSLEDIGFSADELTSLLADKTAGLTDPDDVPDAPAVPVSRKGDLWILGNHRLLCGDSTDGEAVARVMKGKKASVCLTDPPYGLGDTKTAKNNYDRYSDTRSNLIDVIAGFFPLAQSVAARIVLTPGNANVRLYQEPTWTMAWFTPAGVGSGPWGFCCWQPILCFGKDPKLSSGRGRHPDALVHTEAAEDLGHPCAKPIKFWSWLMQRVSEPGDLIYEPFCGSGTTMIAAEMEGRHAYCMELSEAYVDVIVKRWQAFTGLAARLEGDMRTFDEIAADRARKAA